MAAAISFGDTVRILNTPETRAAECAERIGTCYGFTTPSVTGVEVIGRGGNDQALNVTFEGGSSAWFDPSVVAFVGLNAGQTATIGDKRFVRLPTGEWVESSEPT
jgi:hypothetical protein